MRRPARPTFVIIRKKDGTGHIYMNGEKLSHVFAVKVEKYMDVGNKLPPTVTLSFHAGNVEIIEDASEEEMSKDTDTPQITTKETEM